MPQPPDGPRFTEKFFGRRAGQTLRENHVRLVENLLPQLRIADRRELLQDPRVHCSKRPYPKSGWKLVSAGVSIWHGKLPRIHMSDSLAANRS